MNLVSHPAHAERLGGYIERVLYCRIMDSKQFFHTNYYIVGAPYLYPCWKSKLQFFVLQRDIQSNFNIFLYRIKNIEISSGHYDKCYIFYITAKIQGDPKKQNLLLLLQKYMGSVFFFFFFFFV